jgi:tripartite-type tricarboxylate transporter receptor subunit TctC
MSAAILCLPLLLHAQAYPTKTITIVVPFQAGGPVDMTPRLIAQSSAISKLSTVIVENRPGAGGNVGAAMVAKAPADGYTLLAFAGGVMTTNRWLFRNMPFTAEKDFAPIAILTSTPNVIVVPASLKVTNLKELIALAQAQPGTLNYATPGAGTSPHLCMELFKRAAGGLSIEHVPYKGGSAVIQDLLAGRVQVSCSNLSPILPYVKAGSLRALAVTSSKRTPSLPDVPTAEEAGLNDFEVLGWFGLSAPANTPPAVIQTLNVNVNLALREPGVVEKLNALGLVPVGGTPADMKTYIEAESARWRKVIDQAQIKIE